MTKLYSLSLAIAFALGTSASARTIALKELIDLAQMKDHRTEAAHAKEQVVEANASIKSSAYLPSLHLQAIDSTGFPGSSSSLGLGGIINSPFRSGAGVDVVLKQNLWDFGRTSGAIEVANRNLESQKVASRELASQLAREASSAYFACVQAKSALNYWIEIEGQAKTIAAEAEKFVKTGQKSIIEKYLSKSQLDEFTRKREDARNDLKFATAYLNQLAQNPDHDLDCSSLTDLHRTDFSIGEKIELNSTYARVASDKNAADATVKLSKADYYPKLIGVGSAGLFAQSRLVNKQDYALGIGLEFPLFEGGVTRAKVHQAESARAQKEYELLAQTDEIKKTNLFYNQKIEAERQKIQSVTQELEEARTAYRLAHSRYFDLQGTLVDLRETMKFLLSTQIESTQARVNFLKYNVEKAIFNGEIESLGPL